MKIMLATKNPGKIKEITKILQGSNIELFSHKEIEIPEVEETGMTFVENALLKARSSSDVTGLPSIADDSGIEVDYLNAQPGVRSARYSGENATNEINNIKLLEDNDFFNFKISVKSSDVFLAVKAYQLLSKSHDYPLHLGITEAGGLLAGSIKSSIGIGSLLMKGIGDTIRAVSYTHLTLPTNREV